MWLSWLLSWLLLAFLFGFFTGVNQFGNEMAKVLIGGKRPSH
jgi:hypothetical protein